MTRSACVSFQCCFFFLPQVALCQDRHVGTVQKENGLHHFVKHPLGSIPSGTIDWLREHRVPLLLFSTWGEPPVAPALSPPLRALRPASLCQIILKETTPLTSSRLQKLPLHQTTPPTSSQLQKLPLHQFQPLQSPHCPNPTSLPLLMTQAGARPA